MSWHRVVKVEAPIRDDRFGNATSDQYKGAIGWRRLPWRMAEALERCEWLARVARISNNALPRVDADQSLCG
jgi:hypothetical protein